MIFYITAVANGFLNTVNKMVNVKAGECLGTANGALINYVEATIISLCLIFVTGNGAEMNFSHITEVPPLFYLGSVCGLIAMIFLILGTSHTGAFGTAWHVCGTGLCIFPDIQLETNFRHLFDHCRHRLAGIH